MNNAQIVPSLYKHLATITFGRTSNFVKAA